MSPLVDFVGLPSTTPVTVTRRPSVASPSVEAGIARARERCRIPTAANPLVAGRISSWPYGSASGPRTVDERAARGRR